MIIALAGRRVDSPDSKEPRFPLENVPRVQAQIRDSLKETGATVLVSSAACGADLIALSAAEELKLRRRVILPFDRKRFRETSVTDRPGDWGPLYDRIIDSAEAASDLVILSNGPDAEAYSAANSAILNEAIALANATHQPASALLIWNGVTRGDQDLTEEFGVEARKHGLAVAEILTT